MADDLDALRQKVQQHRSIKSKRVGKKSKKAKKKKKKVKPAVDALEQTRLKIAEKIEQERRKRLQEMERKRIQEVEALRRKKQLEEAERAAAEKKKQEEAAEKEAMEKRKRQEEEQARMDAKVLKRVFNPAPPPKPGEKIGNVKKRKPKKKKVAVISLVGPPDVISLVGPPDVISLVGPPGLTEPPAKAKVESALDKAVAAEIKRQTRRRTFRT